MNKFNYLGIGKSEYNGFIKKVTDFVVGVQLKDSELWTKIANVFSSSCDDFDEGWRGEFWGKMMRGASLTYAYTKDSELYDVLKKAVETLLSRQESNGRISTYSVKKEFNGWDIWSRKYVMVGLEYFYRICTDELLKNRIICALTKHADYIIEHIGVGKIAITETSEWWGACNSSSILDAFLQLYKLTGDKKYLTFSEYIISCGGSSNGSLITCVEEGKLKPHEFPVTKAYEMMSFFEGLLTYYEITGEKHYFDVVVKFFELINKYEQTIVGSMGYTHELFSDTTRLQTEASSDPMLETCVTVTWIRILSRLLLITGDVKYADRIEISAYNALLGTVNFNMLDQYSKEVERIVYGLPFDSYSPLVQGYRGRLIGGFKQLPDGSHYGCCACIAAAATSLFPLDAVLTENNGLIVNYYLNGKAEAELVNDNKIDVTICTDYPKTGIVRLSLKAEEGNEYFVKLRIPAWCNSANVVSNGKTANAESGYYLIDNLSGDVDIEIEFSMPLRVECLNGKTAFLRGPLVLARDENKENRKIDFNKEAELLKDEKGNFLVEEKTACGDENYRCTVKTKDGDVWVLSDYAQCGKNWTDEYKDLSVWFKVN